MQKKLLEHHPNWKIPERRVKKFLKRHLSKHSDPSCADDDGTTTTVSSTKSSPAKRLLKFLKIKKSNPPSSNVPEAAPQSSSVPDEVSTPKAGNETKLEELVVADPEPYEELEPLSQSRSLEQAYSDDNDGKKHDCHCSDACSVM